TRRAARSPMPRSASSRRSTTASPRSTSSRRDRTTATPPRDGSRSTRPRSAATRAASRSAGAARAAISRPAAPPRRAPTAARAPGGPSLVFQLRVYPVTDHRFDTPSYRENADGYFLTKDAMEWFWNHYLGRPADGEQAMASPLRAKNLGGLPPAFIMTAEYDPLRDEAEAYAARLREAGVETKMTRYDGTIRGFCSMGNALTVAKRGMMDATSALRNAFALRPAAGGRP